MPCRLDRRGRIVASTQWAAAMLGHQPRLGAPWAMVLGQPIYHPWRPFEWWFAYEACAPAVFRKAGILAAGSGMAGTMVAVAGSLWRGRQTKLVTTYGSARCASFDEVRKAKLFAGHGVLFGKLGEAYLRNQRRAKLMSIIGTFVATTDGYVGTIRTLAIHAKLRIVAVEKKAREDAPEFRILFGVQEVGAAWKAKTHEAEPRDYLSAMLDDPMFAEPLRGALFEDGDKLERIRLNPARILRRQSSLHILVE
jgi:uncharacterized protein (DUF736 family)